MAFGKIPVEFEFQTVDYTVGAEADSSNDHEYVIPEGWVVFNWYFIGHPAIELKQARLRPEYEEGWATPTGRIVFVTSVKNTRPAGGDPATINITLTLMKLDGYLGSIVSV